MKTINFYSSSNICKVKVDNKMLNLGEKCVGRF